MADEIRNLRIKASVEGLDQVKRGFSDTQASIITLNQALDLGRAAFGYASTAARTLADELKRGDQYNSVLRSFKGNLDELSKASGGLIDNFTLLKQANLAESLGITNEAFKTLVTSADALADKTGGDATEALELMTQALGRGNDKQLIALGINIDAQKTYEDLAAQLGVNVSALTELQKRQAFAEAATIAITKATEGTSNAVSGAGEEYDRLGIVIKNAQDDFAGAIDNNKALAAALVDLTAAAKTLVAIDWSPFLKAIGTAIQLTPGLNNLAEALKAIRSAVGYLADSGKDKTLENLAQQAKVLQTQIDTFGKPNMYSKLGQDTTELEKELKLVTAAFGEAARAAGVTGTTVENTSVKIDKTTVAATKLVGAVKEGEGLPPIISSQEVLPEIEKIDAAFTDMARGNAEFFADILTSTITGSAQDIGDIFENAFQRVAIGFGSELLSQIATAAGLNLGGLGGAQGLGASLAQSLTGSGASGIFGSLFGGGGASPSALGIGAGGGSAAGRGAAAAGGFSFASLAALAPFAAIAGTGFLAQRDYKDQRVSPELGAALALPTGGLSVVASLFGGFGGGDPDRLARNGLRDKFSETGLGDRLNNTDFNVDFSNPLAGQAVGLGKGLGTLFGGSGKLGDDATGIFSNEALEGAESFNEVLVKMQGLLDDVGLSAEDAKAQLTDAFLAGDVALEDFGAGIQSFNQLAQDNLTGTGSVSDALQLLADSIGGPPRDSLKALELAFKEAAELGITNSSELAAYVSDKFGPGVKAVFDRIGAAGINSFEDIKNASGDQIFAIFSGLQDFKDEIVNVFGDSADAADDFKNSTDAIAGSLRKVRDEAEKTKQALKGIGSSSGNASGVNPNPVNNKFA